MMARVTTAFADVTQSLLGDLVDVDGLREIAKMHPDSSSVHTPGQLVVVGGRRRKGKGAVDKSIAKASVPALMSGYANQARASVSALLPNNKMAAALQQQGRQFKVPQGPGMNATPTQQARFERKAQRGAMRVGPATQQIQAGHAARQASSSRAPLEAARARQAQRVADPSSVRRPLAGIEPTAPARSATQRGAAAGAGARADFNAFAGTTSGKVALGGAGVYGGSKLLGGRKQESAYADPYGYAKRDGADEVTWGGTFSKFDDEKRLAFGWASVVELNGQPVIDRQGDVISMDEIEKASYEYMLNSRVGGDMHRRTMDDRPMQVSRVVESVVFTPEKCTAMGISKDMAGRWWLGVKVDDESSWQAVRKGERTGFSIHGKGLRKSTTVEELMMGISR